MDHNARQKHVWRAEIILLSADGVGTVDMMRQTGKSKTCVWRWQGRFAGLAGLKRSFPLAVTAPYSGGSLRPVDDRKVER